MVQAMPQILKSKEVNQILREPARRRAKGLKELVRIAEEEPHRLQVQRSCYTKVIRAFGQGKRKMWREALWFLTKCRDFLINDDVLMCTTRCCRSWLQVATGSQQLRC